METDQSNDFQSLSVLVNFVNQMPYNLILNDDEHAQISETPNVHNLNYTYDTGIQLLGENSFVKENDDRIPLDQNIDKNDSEENTNFDLDSKAKHFECTLLDAVPYVPAVELQQMYSVSFVNQDSSSQSDFSNIPINCHSFPIEVNAFQSSECYDFNISQSAAQSIPNNFSISSEHEFDTYLTADYPNSSIVKTSVNALQVNDQSNQIDKVICKYCNRQFSKIRYLKQHISAHHNGEKAYKCSKCGKKFADKQLLEHHLSKHSVDKPYKCDLCPKQYNYKIDLSRHMATHNRGGQRIFKCNLCGKGFPRIDHLRNHCKSHERKALKKQQIDYNTL